MRGPWLVAIAAVAALTGVRPVPPAAPTGGLPALVVAAVEAENQRKVDQVFPSGPRYSTQTTTLISVESVRASGDRAVVRVTIESILTFADAQVASPYSGSRMPYTARFEYRDRWVLTRLHAEGI